MPSSSPITTDETQTDVAAPPQEEHEPCPVPLGWQHVVEQVQEQAEELTVSVGDVSVRLRTIGSGPPLYFLRGLLGTADLYSLLIWLLKDDFRCVIEVEPHGLPGVPNLDAQAGDDDPVHQWARCLLGIATEFGDQRFDLFASSFGVPTALDVMMEAPDRVRRAVLQAAFLNRQYTRFERLMLWTGRQRRQPLSSGPGINKLLENNHGPWFPPYDTTRPQFLIEQVGQTDVATLCQRASAVDARRFSLDVTGIKQPILMVTGEGAGQIAQQHHDQLHERLTNSTTEIMHTCGQLPYLTHPHRLAKSIKAFLTE